MRSSRLLRQNGRRGIQIRNRARGGGLEGAAHDFPYRRFEVCDIPDREIIFPGKLTVKRICILQIIHEMQRICSCGLHTGRSAGQHTEYCHYQRNDASYNAFHIHDSDSFRNFC